MSPSLRVPTWRYQTIAKSISRAEFPVNSESPYWLTAYNLAYILQYFRSMNIRGSLPRVYGVPSQAVSHVASVPQSSIGILL